MSDQVIEYIPVPPEKWGRDHHSTLLYVEAMCVDNRGRLKNPNMRTHAGRHPRFISREPFAPGDGSRYPTILAAGDELPEHDDWDCLYDLRAAGLLGIQIVEAGLAGHLRAFRHSHVLVEWYLPVSTGKRGKLRGPYAIGLPETSRPLSVRCRLTAAGWDAAAELRRRRASGRAA